MAQTDFDATTSHVVEIGKGESSVPNASIVARSVQAPSMLVAPSDGSNVVIAVTPTSAPEDHMDGPKDYGPENYDLENDHPYSSESYGIPPDCQAPWGELRPRGLRSRALRPRRLRRLKGLRTNTGLRNDQSKLYQRSVP